MIPHRNGMRPIHPGEILLEEFLRPLEMSASALAQAIGVPPNRITQIVAEERNITADTALRLARAFGTTPEFWLNMQQSYDLRVAEQDASLAKDVGAIKRLIPTVDERSVVGSPTVRAARRRSG